MNKPSLEIFIKKLNSIGSESIITIMTPISSTTFLNANDSRDELLKKIEKSKRTFYPVYSESPENIIGIIHIKEILIEALKNSVFDIREGLHEPIYFSENNSIHQVYNIFVQSNTGAAFVVNKLNNIIGFITLKEVTRSILGSLTIYENLYESYQDKKTGGT